MKKMMIAAIFLLGISQQAYSDEGSQSVQRDTVDELNVKNLSQSEKQELLREVFKSGNKLKLTNFKTNQLEVIDDPYSLTKEQALNYLPEVPEIVGIFNIYAEENPPYAALIKTYGDIQKML